MKGVSIFYVTLLIIFLISSTQAEILESNTWFENGNKLIQEEKWGEAIIAFKNVIESEPTNSVAWFKLGGSYLQNGNTADSFDAYKKATEIDPNYADAWAMTGYVLLFGLTPPDAKGAIQAYEKTSPLLGNDSGITINYGIANLITKNYEVAEKTFNELTQMDVFNERAWFWLGITQSETGNLEEGLKSYTKAININPQYKEAWYSKSDVETHLGKTEEATESLEKADNIKTDVVEPFIEVKNNDEISISDKKTSVAITPIPTTTPSIDETSVIKPKIESNLIPKETPEISSSSSGSCPAGKCWVNPYTRKDGTAVKGYCRKC